MNTNYKYPAYSYDSATYPLEIASSSSSEAIYQHRPQLDPAFTMSSYNNRTRNDTNDSLSTMSSSEELGIPTPNRRRHRARGCRAGRKHKKNKEKVKQTPLGEAETEQGNAPFQSMPAVYSSFSYTSLYKDENPKQPVLAATENIYKTIQKQMPINSIQDKNCYYISGNTSHTYIPGDLVSHQVDPRVFSYKILPPLLQTKSDSPKNIMGPNPYALQHSNASGTFSNNPATPARGDNNTIGRAHRAFQDHHRIEQQRQMLSDGGSLFVTSPRSFLMGTRKLPAW